MNRDQSDNGVVYLRGKNWYLDYTAPSGERIQRSTGQRDKRYAESLLAAERKAIKAGKWIHPDERAGGSGAAASGRFADDWARFLERRADVITLHDDIRDGKNHILPFFEKRRTADVTGADLLDFFAVLRRKKKANGELYSANTIRCIVTRLRTFFNEAVAREEIIISPFKRLSAAQIPQEPDRHMLAEVTRIYTEAEIIALISDPRIDLLNRVTYALQFFTGTRISECVGLHWAKWDMARRAIRVTEQCGGRPLKGKRGKPGAPRIAPLHPELARILEEWRSDGFPALVGRSPEPADHILPGLERCWYPDPRKWRNPRTVEESLARDLATIGADASSSQTHGFRRTWITCVQEYGGDRVWLERMTHNSAGDIVARYTKDKIEAMRRMVETVPLARGGRATVHATFAERSTDTQESRYSARDSGFAALAEMAF